MSVYFLFVNQDWRNAEEFPTESEARAAWSAVMDDGYENAHSAAVYEAPNRAAFKSHMGRECRVVCAGIPQDHPFLNEPHRVLT